MYLSVCLSVDVSARCDWSSLPPRQYVITSIVNISTLHIYRQRPNESGKDIKFIANDGVVAMTLP